ncbi:MAG: hypothetical protein ABI548_05415 [Polyangiaceae bacterium]
MKLTKLTTLLVVDAIEPCLNTWQALGYAITVRVPEEGPLGFTILSGPAGELMLQTRSSLAEDLPAVHAKQPSHLLYGDVASLETATKAALASNAKVLVPQRKTFYGADEIWFELTDGMILGLAEHTS